MENSIFISLKNALLGNSEDDDFDTELMIHINTVFSFLYQLGVGPENGFRITGNTELWSDYLDSEQALDMVKTYMFLKVKTIFDPPAGSVLTSYETQIKELEWRLTVFGSQN